MAETHLAASPGSSVNAVTCAFPANDESNFLQACYMIWCLLVTNDEAPQWKNWDSRCHFTEVAVARLETTDKTNTAEVFTFAVTALEWRRVTANYSPSRLQQFDATVYESSDMNPDCSELPALIFWESKASDILHTKTTMLCLKKHNFLCF